MSSHFLSFRYLNLYQILIRDYLALSHHHFNAGVGGQTVKRSTQGTFSVKLIFQFYICSSKCECLESGSELLEKVFKRDLLVYICRPEERIICFLCFFELILILFNCLCSVQPAPFIRLNTRLNLGRRF